MTAPAPVPAEGRTGETPALRTPGEWQCRKGIRILDPDGWRGRDGRPWSDPITEAEFDQRAAPSTQSPWDWDAGRPAAHVTAPVPPRRDDLSYMPPSEPGETLPAYLQRVGLGGRLDSEISDELVERVGVAMGAVIARMEADDESLLEWSRCAGCRQPNQPCPCAGRNFAIRELIDAALAAVLPGALAKREAAVRARCAEELRALSGLPGLTGGGTPWTRLADRWCGP